jgi:hypothetical protein
MTTTGVNATWDNHTAITVTWPASPGATIYRVERRSGTIWEVAGTTTATSFSDGNRPPNRTWAYRVQAGNGTGAEWSPYSNAAVATTRTFTPIPSQTGITAASVQPMLEAVNSVRAAVGWPAVGWADILSAKDPIPQPNRVVLAAHVLTCRARMNEALQALGVPAGGYDDPILQGRSVRAEHVNKVLERAQ